MTANPMTVNIFLYIPCIKKSQENKNLLNTTIPSQKTPHREYVVHYSDIRRTAYLQYRVTLSDSWYRVAWPYFISHTSHAPAPAPAPAPAVPKVA